MTSIPRETATPDGTTRRSFLDLPAEIRVQIYALMTVPSSPSELSSYQGLFFSCHQIKNEIEYEWTKGNQKYLDDVRSALQADPRTGPRHFSISAPKFLTDVELTFPFTAENDVKVAMSAVFTKFDHIHHQSRNILTWVNGNNMVAWLHEDLNRLYIRGAFDLITVQYRRSSSRQLTALTYKDGKDRLYADEVYPFI